MGSTHGKVKLEALVGKLVKFLMCLGPRYSGRQRDAILSYQNCDSDRKLGGQEPQTISSEIAFKAHVKCFTQKPTRA
jgi:hypothetical protein